MRTEFKNYLESLPNFKSVKPYYNSIDLYLPRQLSEKNILINIFECKIEDLLILQERLDKNGDLEKIGNYSNRTNYYAFLKFIRFRENFDSENHNIDLLEYNSIDNFELEKDLENAIYRNVSALFPDYIKFKNCKQFLLEKNSKKKKIDLLLEAKDKSHLLVIELKAGSIDRNAFGQISEYILLAEEEFNTTIKGCLIGNDFEEHIENLIKTSKFEISLMKYNIEVKLEKYS